MLKQQDLLPPQVNGVQELEAFSTLPSPSFPLTNLSPTASSSSPVLFKAQICRALFTSCFGYYSCLPRSLPDSTLSPSGFIRHELVR